MQGRLTERAGLLGQSFESCFPFAGVLSRWAPCFSWSSTFSGWSCSPLSFSRVPATLLEWEIPPGRLLEAALP